MKVYTYLGNAESIQNYQRGLISCEIYDNLGFLKS